MNRRDLLLGLAASTAIAACPAAIEAAIIATPVVDWRIWWDQWQKDALDVLVKCWEDQIIYGTSAHESCKEYPYVRRIDPTLLTMPPTRGGLLA